jgi:hypothetical protein
MTTLFFINALSRMSLSRQLERDNPGSINLRPEFASGPIIDDSFIGGKELYNHTNSFIPTIPACYDQYRYASAWALEDRGRYMAIGILGMHVILAIAHMIVLCWTCVSSKAWASINELIILAYNSAAILDAFKNRSSGIELSITLEKKVRVGTRTLDDGTIQI